MGSGVFSIKNLYLIQAHEIVVVGESSATSWTSSCIGFELRIPEFAILPLSDGTCNTGMAAGAEKRRWDVLTVC